VLRHALFHPSCPSIEVLLLSLESFTCDETLHHRGFVKVDVDRMSDYTFWTAVLSTGNDPLFFWVEAVREWCFSNLIEHPFNDESGSFFNDHSHLYQMTLLELQDIGIILANSYNFIPIKLVSIVYICVRWEIHITINPLGHLLVFGRD
jgi:hypothetical protein